MFWKPFPLSDFSPKPFPLPVAFIYIKWENPLWLHHSNAHKEKWGEHASCKTFHQGAKVTAQKNPRRSDKTSFKHVSETTAPSYRARRALAIGGYALKRRAIPLKTRSKRPNQCIISMYFNAAGVVATSNSTSSLQMFCKGEVSAVYRSVLNWHGGKSAYKSQRYMFCLRELHKGGSGFRWHADGSVLKPDKNRKYGHLG